MREVIPSPIVTIRIIGRPISGELEVVVCVSEEVGCVVLVVEALVVITDVEVDVVVEMTDVVWTDVVTDVVGVVVVVDVSTVTRTVSVTKLPAMSYRISV